MYASECVERLNVWLWPLVGFLKKTHLPQPIFGKNWLALSQHNSNSSMIPIGSLAGNAQSNVNVILPPPFSLQSAPLLQQGGLGQKRTYLEDPSLSASLEESIHPSLTLATVEKLNNRKKGRKKSYIWAHAVADESGKVYCKHCNTLIKVNFGEKVRPH